MKVNAEFVTKKKEFCILKDLWQTKTHLHPLKRYAGIFVWI